MSKILNEVVTEKVGKDVIKFVRGILKSECNDTHKTMALDLLEEELAVARGVLNGTYRYCPQCDDYYLSKSFLSDTDRKPTKVCTYQDPINSGGNEYADGHMVITYSVCPKGHKEVIDRQEYKD